MSRFEVCLPYTLAQECPFPADWSNSRNFSHDAHDPGGATQCGIIQREYDSFRKRKGETVQSVRLMTRTEGEEIYQTEYWQPYCDRLAPGVDLSFFDASVNEGTHEAIKILQYSLHITGDGAWGQQTDQAVDKIHDAPATIRSFALRRSTVYRMMPGDRYFDEDWQRRTTEIRDASLAMAADAATV